MCPAPREPLPLAARRATEALLERRSEQERGHLVEEAVPRPVRLDDPSVERVVDPVGPGDQLEVRPRSLEASGHLPQASVGDATRAVLEQGAVICRTTQTQSVRWIGEPREPDRPVSRIVERRCAAHGAVAPTPTARRAAARAAPPATAVPARITSRPALCGASGVSFTTASNETVTSTAATSTAVTSTA